MPKPTQEEVAELVGRLRTHWHESMDQIEDPCAICQRAADALEALAGEGAEPMQVELGCPGHLIVAKWCRWRRHTQIGNYRVSTVGDYYPPKHGEQTGPRTTIGAGDDSFFETMVFRTQPESAADNEGCGCHAIADWSELDGKRYATAGEAQAGHEEYVRAYALRALRERA